MSLHTFRWPSCSLKMSVYYQWKSDLRAGCEQSHIKWPILSLSVTLTGTLSVRKVWQCPGSYHHKAIKQKLFLWVKADAEIGWAHSFCVEAFQRKQIETVSFKVWGTHTELSGLSLEKNIITVKGPQVRKDFYFSCILLLKTFAEYDNDFYQESKFLCKWVIYTKQYLLSAAAHAQCALH